MSGFDNDVCFSTNVDFTGGFPVVGQMVADGQLLIGAAAAPFLRAATLSEGEAIDIANAAGSITIACEVATDSNLGVASFVAADFSVAAGAVSLDDDILKGAAGDTGVAAGSSHSITIAGGAGCSTTAAGGTITINVDGAGFDWTRVAGAAQALAISNGYTPTNVAQTAFTLPATAVLGAVMKINGEGTGGFIINQNAGQQITMGHLATTVGVAGSVLAVEDGACCTLRCTLLNTTFVIENSIGNFGLT